MVAQETAVTPAIPITANAMTRGFDLVAFTVISSCIEISQERLRGAQQGYHRYSVNCSTLRRTVAESCKRRDIEGSCAGHALTRIRENHSPTACAIDRKALAQSSGAVKTSWPPR